MQLNPSSSGVLFHHGKKIRGLAPANYFDYIANGLRIRFGSALSSKINKKYWESTQCKNLPFVIAVEAFHDEGSLDFTDSALIRYLYGISETGEFSQNGDLIIEGSDITAHNIRNIKTIKSNLFGQPEAKYISAALFTNSGTQAKFSRMGFQHGIGNNHIVMNRKGCCYCPDSSAMEPAVFSYDLDYPPLVETWGQGISILHNPNAIHPIDKDYFVNALQVSIVDGKIVNDYMGWHPFASKTVIYELGNEKYEISKFIKPPTFMVVPISKNTFHDIIPSNPLDGSSIIECGWYTDETHAFLGLLFENFSSNSWEYIIFGYNQYFSFSPIATENNISSRYEALMRMQMVFSKLLSRPKRTF